MMSRGGVLQFIMPGLDPGILFLAAKKDRRVKPGDDDVVEMSTCFLLPLAQQWQAQGGGERRGVARQEGDAELAAVAQDTVGQQRHADGL